MRCRGSVLTLRACELKAKDKDDTKDEVDVDAVAVVAAALGSADDAVTLSVASRGGLRMTANR